jgi:hypothetical protein
MLFIKSGKYSTNEAECRIRYQNLKNRYGLVLPRLSQWVEGQEARPGTNKGIKLDNDNDDDEETNRHKSVTAIAEVATRRYMPSTIAAPLHANGYAEWDEVREVPKESPIVLVNEKALKMGIVDKHASRKHHQLANGNNGLSKEEEEAEKMKLVNEERKTRSVFSKSTSSSKKK